MSLCVATIACRCAPLSPHCLVAPEGTPAIASRGQCIAASIDGARCIVSSYGVLALVSTAPLAIAALYPGTGCVQQDGFDALPAATN
eukprot:6211901-Pleurochrysis_carterae.AAC.3